MTSESKQDYQLKGIGNVYSYTVISDPNYAPQAFQRFVPYCMALIKTVEGPIVTAMLTDLDYSYDKRVIQKEERLVKKFNVEIGMPVEMVTRILKVDGNDDRGQIIYGYKFRSPIQISGSSKNLPSDARR